MGTLFQISDNPEKIIGSYSTLWGMPLHTKTYDHVHPFNGNIFPVMTRNFWGAINGTGKEIIACAYDSIVQQMGDKIVVKFRGQYGIVNMKEEWIVTPKTLQTKTAYGYNGMSKSRQGKHS